MSHYCYCCGSECGTKLVCESCRIRLSERERELLTELWHDEVCKKAHDDLAERYKCYHCSLFFLREEVCGDHFPHTKGARPDLRFDVANGVCSCAGCNTSGNRKRKQPKKDLCRKCRILIPTYGDLCFRCR